MTKSTVPYGSWPSPITADLITKSGVRALGLMADIGGSLYTLECRPLEGGRYILTRRQENGTATKDITPASFNARTRVHEYGGGSVRVQNDMVYFANFSDQRLYRQDVGGSDDEAASNPDPLTPVDIDLRYADFELDLERGRILAVREDHREGGDQEAVNTIVAVDLSSGMPNEGVVLVGGSDFFAYPRLSPDGSKLIWQSWNHPNMPWNGSELWMATVKDDGSLDEPLLIAGGPDESIFQPSWSPNGTVTFVSDRSGWWNLYQWDGSKGKGGDGTHCLLAMEAEFGKPQWGFGTSTYAFIPSPVPGEQHGYSMLVSYGKNGIWYQGILDPATGKLEEIKSEYTYFDSLIVVDSQTAYLLAESPTSPTALIKLDLTNRTTTVLHSFSSHGIDSNYISVPETIVYPTVDPKLGKTVAHAFFYPPCNPDIEQPKDEKPPLLVFSHGGPTSATNNGVDMKIQFWTSRGIGVLDCNYGGSTGYGRAYRNRLEGAWGIVDIDDCCQGAVYLAEKGLADRDRLMIRGGSAGGYTTLSALAFRDVFAAGASYYGVSDLSLLAEETHKFESRYLDKLIGSYPESKDIYNERSALCHTENFSCPVIFFQGMEDKVVLPNQAEKMVEALLEKKLPVAYVPFEGEQHGFRKAENIKRALEAELYFYSRIFKFALADEIEPVEIKNL